MSSVNSSLIKEFFEFLKHSKKWWLLPIIVILVLLSTLIMLSSNAVFPMIYSFF